VKSNLFIFAILAFSSVVSANAAKLSPELQQVDANAVVPVIVQFFHQPVDSDHQRLSGRGASLRTKLGSVMGGAYRVPAYALQDLAQDPNVKYISPDRPISAKLDYSTAAINASAAWESAFVGSGIGVAVIDSGLTPVRDLTGKQLIYSEDFVGGNGHDEYGHGEHIAGIIGASGTTSECPQCNRLL
jgi:serine protease AprX